MVKKILVFLISLSVLLGLSGIIAADSLPTQVIVTQGGITFNFAPSTLDFGTLTPGSTNPSTSPITFSVTSGNVDVTLAVSGINGQIFQNIMTRNTGDVDPTPWTLLSAKSDVVACTPSGDPLACTYPKTLSWDTKLTVGPGVVPAKYTGDITYTVTGSAS